MISIDIRLVFSDQSIKILISTLSGLAGAFWYGNSQSVEGGDYFLVIAVRHHFDRVVLKQIVLVFTRKAPNSTCKDLIENHGNNNFIRKMYLWGYWLIFSNVMWKSFIAILFNWHQTDFFKWWVCLLESSSSSCRKICYL